MSSELGWEPNIKLKDTSVMCGDNWLDTLQEVWVGYLGCEKFLT